MPSMPAEAAPDGRDVDDVVAATREIGALIARSLTLMRPVVTMAQWRVVVLASEGDCSLSAIAADLQIHPSNATRLCDRLARQGLIERYRAEQDRRQVLVTLTEAGLRFHDAAMGVRQVAVRRAMETMDPRDRSALTSAMPAFAAALAGARRAPGEGEVVRPHP